MARQNGLKTSNVKPQLAVAGSGRQGGSVFVAVESGWEPLMQILYDLQRSPQGLQVTKAAIARSGEDNSVLVGQFVIYKSEV